MRPSIVVVVAMSVAGCAPSFLPLAERGGDAAFKAQMADSYPPGSSGLRLREDMAGQGFVIESDPGGRRWRAVDAPENLPCFSRTRVDWREDGRGRIVVLTAQRNDCS